MSKEKMNINEFVNEVRGNIKGFLPKAYENAEVSVMDCQKLNVSYKGLMVKREKEMISPIINLDQFYEIYQNQPETTMEVICRRIAKVVMKTPIEVNLNPIMDYNIAKYNLFIRVSSAEKNKDILANVPHQLKEDLAITYHLITYMRGGELSSLLIKNDLLKQYGITAEQLHEDAMNSSPRIMPQEVSSIGEFLEQDPFMMSSEENDMLQESEPALSFYVVTNQKKLDGAGVIFYPGMMEYLGSLFFQDYFILPSSIHEMIVLPDNGEISVNELKMMVSGINATQVDPSERLTDEVYHFDTKDHVFEKADNFIKRKNRAI
ncbi:DUF5688 family protein [Eubacterium ramulus]|uniref:DUF5688 family protein n=1 Tax=Eubacterium ramulus TaxID=39490 RepID=UPI0022E13E5D|nr:DUF5688 family protein [Eubacterium ramulus]